jgi:hypothetical protein
MESRINRRSFLKRAAAITVLTDLEHVWRASGSHFSLKSGPGWLALCRDGREMFRLDEAHFHGRPKLWTDISGKTTAFGLDRARFPGTETAADFCCELWEGAFGMHVSLVYRMLGITFRGYAHDWLSDNGLLARVPGPQKLIEASDILLSLAPCQTNLSCSGRLSFHGAACGLAEFLGRTFRCDSVSLELTPGLHGLLPNPALRQTRITLGRGNAHWPLVPPAGAWRYGGSGGTLFDSLHVEAHESVSQRRRYVALATRDSTREPVPIELETPLFGTDGQKAPFFVEEPNYRVTVGSDTRHVVTAKLAGTTTLALGSLRLGLRNPAGECALSARASGDTPAAGCIVADADLTGYSGEAIFAPGPNDEPWRVRVDTAKLGNAQKRSDATLRMVGKDPALSGNVQFHILRPSDFLDLTFQLRNVEIRSKGPETPNQQEIWPGPGQGVPSLLIAYLPPQTLAEWATPLSTPVATDVCEGLPTLDPGTTKPNHSRLAPPSRVSLELFTDPDTQFLPISLETFLAWDQYPLHVADSATKSPSCGQAGNPCTGLTDAVTALELPAGLVFSPNEYGIFKSSDRPRADKNTYQIWTARLRSLDGGAPVVRPICQRQLPEDFNYALTNPERQAIVAGLKNASVPVKHLTVSTAGGWLNGSATFPADPCSGVQSFRAEIASGFEMLEEATYKGYLVPTGHLVAVVVTTKRQWCRDQNNFLSGNLIKRYKIRFDEKTRDYTQYVVSSQGFALPFTSISLVGKETLYLDATDASNFIGSCDCAHPGNYAYWAKVNLAPHTPSNYEFPVIAVDRNGNEHATTMQMLVACGNRVWDRNYVQFLSGEYANNPNAGPNFGGKRVSYATWRKMGDTAYPTLTINLTAELMSDFQAAQKARTLPWYPQMASAVLDLDHTARFSKKPPKASAFGYSKPYKSDPFDLWDAQANKWVNSLKTTTNKGEVLLEVLPGNSLPLDFAGNMAGGLAMPSTQVQAVSRRLGTVFSKASAAAGGADQNLENIANGIFNIADAFDDGATLLGAVPLADIFGGLSDALSQAASVPRLAARQLLQAEQDVLGQINQVLAPLQAVQQSLQQAIVTANTEINGARDQFTRKVRQSIALLRISLLEQRAGDLAFLIGQPPSGITSGELTRLRDKLNQSIQLRIQQANSLFGVPDQPTLPTVPQLRDYLFNAALNNAISLSSAPLGAINDYFSEDLAELNASLDSVLTSADLLVTQLTGSALFVLAQQLPAFLDALAQGDLPQAWALLGPLADALGGVAQADLKTVVIASVKAVQDKANDCKTRLVSRVNGLQTKLQAVTDGALHSAVNQITDKLNKDLDVSVNSTATYQALDAILTAANALNALADELKVVQNTVQTHLDAANDAIETVKSLLKLPVQVSVTYDWETPLRDHSVFVASHQGRQSRLTFHSQLVFSLGQGSPRFTISAKVSDFSLLLLPSSPFLQVGFNSASFESSNGTTPQVRCDLDKDSVQLIGPLDFVSRLAESIQLPAGLVVQQLGTGVVIAFNLNLPSIESGAFLLTGVSFYSGVHLDFTGEPLRLQFGFSHPNHHFIMAYTIFGGGGFLGMELTPQKNGVSMALDGALEFGVVAALDFGVASGEVHVFGGFYFEMHPDEVRLTGYNRAGGELDVLGLISVCVEFLMALTYENRGGQAWLSGECDLTVEVDVLFFSTSVDLRLHHDFSGNSAS